MKIRYLQDAGHGWFEVPMALINELKIGPKISAYSYVSRDGELAYLEEDCDASLFHHAMLASKREYSLDEQHLKGDCFIRRLASWRTIRPLFAAEDLPAPAPRAGETLTLF